MEIVVIVYSGIQAALQILLQFCDVDLDSTDDVFAVALV
jgi:hypothetical protein